MTYHAVLVEMQNCSETIVDKFLITSGDPMLQTQPDVNVSGQDGYSYSLWNRLAESLERVGRVCETSW